MSSHGGTTSGEECFRGLSCRSTKDPYNACCAASSPAPRHMFTASGCPSGIASCATAASQECSMPQPDPPLPCVAATGFSRSSTATGSSLSMAPLARRWSGTPTWSCLKGGRRAPLGCPWWTPICVSWRAQVSAGFLERAFVQAVRCTV